MSFSTSPHLRWYIINVCNILGPGQCRLFFVCMPAYKTYGDHWVHVSKNWVYVKIENTHISIFPHFTKMRFIHVKVEFVFF